MFEISLFSAFIAGLLTFLAPCTFPLLPAYMATISGASVTDFNEKSDKSLRFKVIKNGIFFVFGFSLIFIAFGILASFVGSKVLFDFRIIITRIGGVLIIIFGVLMLDIFKFNFLQKSKKFNLPKFTQSGSPIGSFVIGSTFALGWTPCVGPILGAIITLAATSSTVAQGGMLLVVFSLGLAVPFLLVAVFLGTAFKYMKRINKYLNIIAKIGGVFLIIIGFLLLTNNFDYISRYAFQLLAFLNYDLILNYL